MLCNVGTTVIFSDIGLISTVAYQLGVDQPVCYALEGSGSIGGNVIRFLRDNLQLIKVTRHYSVSVLIDYVETWLERIRAMMSNLPSRTIVTT